VLSQQRDAVRRFCSELRSQQSVLVLFACVFYLFHVVFQGKTAVSEIAAGFTVVCVYIALRKRELTWSWHILYFPLGLYALASTISSLVAPERIHMFGEQMLWVKVFTFPAALVIFRNVPQMRRLALWGHAVFLTWISLDGLIQYFALGQRDLEHRITGTATHVMTYSGELLPLSLLFLVLAARERHRWMFVPAILSAFALLLTFTRSAWVGWLAAVLVLIITVRPRLMAYAVPVLVLFFTFMPVSMFGRFASIFSTRQESNLDRIRMLQAGVEIIRDYPIWGVGPANIKPLYPLYRLPDSPRFRTPHLHNNVMQIWAERGIVALFAYVLLLYLFLRECARGWRGAAGAWAQAGAAVAISLTIAGMFEFNFGDTEVFYLLLDLCALVTVQLESGGEYETRNLLFRRA
jgi:O-antigen ligase